jgi:DNA-binding GntR family transcriptional regulator
MTAQPELRRVAAPLREQVTDILRADIVAGKLEPGARLVEMTLCTRFGVSRPVVREALRHLAAEGLVESIPNRGTVVTQLTLEDARDLYEVRAALEGLAGALFAERATDAERVALKKAWDKIKRSYSKGAIAEQIHGKDEFYAVLLNGARNNVIHLTLVGIHARIQILRGVSMQVPGRLKTSLAELREITDAAVAGDAEAAGAACRRHIDHAADIALAALRERLSAE